MRSTRRAAMVSAFIAGWLVGCSTAPPTAETRNELREQATAAMKEMNREDPSVEPFAGKCYCYALFP
jgi:hypothetical protein